MELRRNWQGTATQLLQEIPELKLQPNVFTRKLNVGMERLYLEKHIRYESSRGHDGRIILLVKEENTLESVAEEEGGAEEVDSVEQKTNHGISPKA